MSDQPPDDEGADLASQFFKAVQDRNINLDGDEIDEEEDEDLPDIANAKEEELDDDDDDDDDDAILREYDVSTSEGSTLTNEQIYDEVKDRVFESAGAFVELTRGAEDDSEGAGAAKRRSGAFYEPPEDFPDSGLTAGEVVELVLSALRNNDNPTPNYGVQILFAYSSPESQIVEQIETERLTPAQYKNFLSMSDDTAFLLAHGSAAIDKADFSPDGRKGYFTARLMEDNNAGGDVMASRNDISVNFILSTTGTEDGDCWLINSMLVRPSKLRRRRRR